MLVRRSHRGRRLHQILTSSWIPSCNRCWTSCRTHFLENISIAWVGWFLDCGGLAVQDIYTRAFDSMASWATNSIIYFHNNTAVQLVLHNNLLCMRAINPRASPRVYCLVPRTSVLEHETFNIVFASMCVLCTSLVTLVCVLRNLGAEFTPVYCNP